MAIGFLKLGSPAKDYRRITIATISSVGKLEALSPILVIIIPIYEDEVIIYDIILFQI